MTRRAIDTKNEIAVGTLESYNKKIPKHTLFYNRPIVVAIKILIQR